MMRDRIPTLVLVAAVIVIAGSMAAGPRRFVDRYRAWTTSLQRMAAASVTAAGPTEPAAAVSTLLVVHGDQGPVVALLAGDVAAPVLVVVPEDLTVVVPGYGIYTIAEAVDFEDATLAALSLANALGVRIDTTWTVTAAEAAALLPGPVELPLPAPVVVDGRVFPAGEEVRPPDDVVALLTGPGDDDALDRVRRRTVAWRAFLDAAVKAPRGPEILAVRADDPAVARDAFLAAATGFDVTVVPSRRVGTEERPGFVLLGAELPGFVASRLAGLGVGEPPRPRVEVLNGNGRLQSTRSVVEALVGAGLHVLRTDNAERFDVPDTLVVAQGRDGEAAARLAAAVLGIDEIRLETRTPSGIVDVSIIVGRDLAGQAGEG